MKNSRLALVYKNFGGTWIFREDIRLYFAGLKALYTLYAFGMKKPL